MVNIFTKMISGFLQKLAEDSINFVLTFFSYIGGLGNVVLDMPVVTTGILYTQEVAGLFLSLKIAYEMYMIYILRQMGESHDDPKEYLIGAIRSAAMIAVMPWLIRYLYGYGMNFGFEISNLSGGASYSNVNENTFTGIVNLLGQAGTAVFFISIAIIFSIVMLAIIVIQSFIRAIELAVQAWDGAIAALSMTNRESQAWSRWWKDTAVICMAGAIQILLLRLSFYTLTPIQIELNGKLVVAPAVLNLLLFIAGLWVTYKSPTALKERMHATGLGKVGGSVAQNAGQMLIGRFMRK